MSDLETLLRWLADRRAVVDFGPEEASVGDEPCTLELRTYDDDGTESVYASAESDLSTALQSLIVEVEAEETDHGA